jgi:tRNA 2-thiouridine synthesizing protein E
MAIEFEGKSIETSPNGFLINTEDWTEGLATQIASSEGLELTEKHWDIINFLRAEHSESGNQPNTRNIVKAMAKKWGEKIDAKVLYDLFPSGPDKQAGRVAGLPESRRKGGY